MLTQLTDLIQNELVQVWHVSLVGDRTLVIIFEVLLQSHRVMGNVHDCTQVVGQHLKSEVKTILTSYYNDRLICLSQFQLIVMSYIPFKPCLGYIS